ncbi:MAG: hypothetical protein IKA85_05275 [Clostridia bacterium]|nr:hypothetical protein [Clostridia bacterium]
MIEFLNLIAPYFYVLTIIFGVLFGISLAVNLWVSRTIFKIKKETDKNYFSNLTPKEINQVNFAINTAINDFVNLVKEDEKNKKKKIENIDFKDDNTSKKYDVLHNLIIDVYEPFSVINENYRGYLSLTKNEIFGFLKTLLDRIDVILSSSDVKFVKKIKISHLLVGKDFYDGYKKSRENFLVKFICSVIDFFIWFFRITSPASLTKYVVKKFSNQGVVLQFWSAIVEIAGKELAVIYKEERFKTAKNLQNNKKVG